MGNLARLTAAAMLAIGFAGEVLAGGGSCDGDYVIVECQLDPEGDFTVFAVSGDGDGVPDLGLDDTADCTEALDLLYNADNPGFFLREATSGSTDRTVYTWISKKCGD